MQKNCIVSLGSKVECISWADFENVKKADERKHIRSC